MAGHREDGTFAEDKAHHPNRKVSRITHSQDTDVAPAQGIPRPEVPSEKPDWSSLTPDENGYATIFNRNTPAEHIKKEYAKRFGSPSDFASGPVVDGPNDYDLGSADAEDLREQSELSNERMKKGHY